MEMFATIPMMMRSMEGGDQRGCGARRRDDGGRELGRISAVLHGGQRDRAYRGGVGARGARDAGEQHGRQYHDETEAAADSSDEHRRQRHDAPRDAAVSHDGAGQDEQRDGQEWERIDPGEKLLRQQHEMLGIAVDDR
jgi:hypothetical protein